MGKAKQLAVLQSAGFSLIAVDTGILRTLEDKQMQWLEAALQRAGDNSKFVILGHPFYTDGVDQVGDNTAFAAIHDLLHKDQVDVAMAGDTHDFELYREVYQQSRFCILSTKGGEGDTGTGTRKGISRLPAVKR